MTQFPLSPQGLRMLMVLAKPLSNKTNKITEWTYKQLADHLGISNEGRTDGDRCRRGGMDELNEWCMAEGLPPITGLILDARKEKPGGEFFTSNGITESSYNETRQRIVSYDWSFVITLAEQESLDSASASHDTESQGPGEAEVENFDIFFKVSQW